MRSGMLNGARRAISAMAAGALGMALASAAQAAPMVWSTPVAITSADQALFSAAQVQYAVSWGNTAQTVTLTGGQTVSFSNGAIDGTGLVQVTGAYGIAGPGSAGYAGTSNSAFNAVMNGFAYDGVQTIKLTGLTIGQTYSIQLFSIDNRGCCGPRTQTFSDQNGNTSAAYLHNADDYLIGTFTAGAATQTFTGAGQTINGSCSGNVCSNLNAVVLRQVSAVPEPASWGLMIVGFGGVGAAMRRRPRESALAA